MRRAVYEPGTKRLPRPMCPCGSPYAFGVIRKNRGAPYLATSARWNWDGEKFVYGAAPFGMPGPERRGPAQVAMKAEPWAAYGDPHIAFDYYVPLPQPFVCRKCKETVLVETP